MRTFLAKRKRIAAGAALCVAASALVSGCGKSTTSPGLMLSFSSDMSVPKDVSAVGLYIRSKSGTVLYNSVVEAEVDATGRRTVRFPSTFAVLSNGSAASVRVQLIAYGPKTANRKALVMRDTTAGVPTDRLGLLRMPLLWINQGSVVSKTGVTPTSASTTLSALSQDPITGRVSTLADEAKAPIPDTGYPGACEEGQTYMGGQCRSSDLVTVEDFTEESNPDNPKGTCFSVEKCFAEPTQLRYDADGNVDIGGVDPNSVNLALITSDGFGIKLPDGRFAISLSAGSPFEGYTIANGKIKLSPGPLKVLQNGAATALIATAACEPKSDAVGNCGEWNQKENSIAPKPNTPPAPFPDAGFSDAGPLVDAGPFKDAEQPFDGGPLDAGSVGRGQVMVDTEPNLMGLALKGTESFFLRNGANVAGNFSMALVQFDPATPKQVIPIVASTYPLQDGYRLDDLTFPANVGGSNFKGKRMLFAYSPTAAVPGLYVYDTISPPLIFQIPALFTPFFFAVSDGIDTLGGPIAFGASGNGKRAYIYSSDGIQTEAPLSNLVPSESIICGDTAAPNTYVVGTNEGRVYECMKLPNTSVSVNCSLKTAFAGGSIADVVVRGGITYILVVSPTAVEETYEGLYTYFNGTTTPLATRANYPYLHFENMNAGKRNRVATNGVGYVYVTTKAAQGLTSRVMAVPIGGGAPTVLADSLYAARDVLVDGSYVYYTDFGAGGNVATGGIYRNPTK